MIRLIGLLSGIVRDPELRVRLVLKGGTALNLFLFTVPRLSVDTDLNYIGSVVLNGKAHYFAAKEEDEGCLRVPVLLAFSQIQA